MDKQHSKKSLPSVAFFITLATGLFWTWFGLTEALSGLFKSPREGIEVSGLFEATIFGLSFIVIAFLLLRWPKLGAMILVCIGIGFGIWITGSFSRIDPLVFTLLTGLPVLLGAFTLVREKIRLQKR